MDWLTLTLGGLASGSVAGALPSVWSWGRGAWALRRVRRELTELGFCERPGLGARSIGEVDGRRVRVRFTPAGVGGRTRPWLRIELATGAPPFRLQRDEHGFSIHGTRAVAATAAHRDLRMALRTGDRVFARAARLVFEARRAPERGACSAWVCHLARAASLAEAPPEARRHHLRSQFEVADDGFEVHLLNALFDQAEREPDLTVEVIERARRDPRPSIRLAAALRTGDVAVVDGIAVDPGTPEATARAALERASASARWSLLGDRRGVPARRALLLRGPREAEWTSSAWAESTRRIAEDPAEPPVVRAAALRALGRGGHEGCEATLLRVLERPDAGATRRSPESLRLQTEALRSLAAIGTERTLAVLHRLSDRAGLWAPLWVPAQAALTAIEARVQPPERGALSVQATSDGGLALTE